MFFVGLKPTLYTEIVVSISFTCYACYVTYCLTMYSACHSNCIYLRKPSTCEVKLQLSFTTTNEGQNTIPDHCSMSSAIHGEQYFEPHI